MSITAILFDAGGVLYHRPRTDRHLAAFLSRHSLKLRHRSTVERAMRAGLFDVQSGRISRAAFYDAILRVHGVQDESLFPDGREALLQDAADIELFPGVLETLQTLYTAGLRLGVISDSAHPAHDKIEWLTARGIPATIWRAFIVSSEAGMLKTGGLIFERALQLLGTTASETAFVGHNSAELARAAEMGLITVAFMPDDPAIQTHYRIGSFYSLRDLWLPDAS